MALLRIRKLKLQIASFTDLWWISFEWIPSLSREPLFPLVYCQTGLFYLLLFLVPCSLIFIEVSSPPLCGELYVFNSLAALLSLNFIVISVFKLVFAVLEDFLSFPLFLYLPSPNSSFTKESKLVMDCIFVTISSSNILPSINATNLIIGLYSLLVTRRYVHEVDYRFLTVLRKYPFAAFTYWLSRILR